MAIAAGLVIWLLAGVGHAADQPVPATNLSPFTAVLGQPGLRSAIIEENTGWLLHSAIASHSAIGENGDETAYLDGETTQFALEVRHAITPEWQLGLTIPWLTHRSGFLDDIIDKWHDVTGLPDGERNEQPIDDLRFLYDSVNGTFGVTTNASDFGDVRIDLVHKLAFAQTWHSAVRISAELATGEPDTLTGNGAADFSADLLFSGLRVLQDRPLSWHAHLGLLKPGDGNLLAQARQDWVGFGGAGLYWRWRPNLSIFVQSALTTAPWRTDVKELGQSVFEGTFGVQWHRRSGRWHLAFSEDLLIDRSPDVVVRFGWRSQTSSSP